ncbi:hypothetical protein [Algoriphagus boritolerans]|uniref:hypothetical protein n=1 Tax=Algoriphagus boritolerans TaxID=308111 RepID=UPI000A82BACE
MDQYDWISVFPIAFGWRGFLGKANKPQLIGGFDMGGGFALLEKKGKDGVVRKPIPRRLVAKSVDWDEISIQKKEKKDIPDDEFGLQTARVGIFSGFFRIQPYPKAFYEYKSTAGYSSITETSYLFHSLVARIGFIF